MYFSSHLTTTNGVDQSSLPCSNQEKEFVITERSLLSQQSVKWIVISFLGENHAKPMHRHICLDWVSQQRTHYTQTHISQPPSHGWPQTVSDGPVLMHITEKSLQEHMQHIPCTLVYHRKQLFLDTSSMESPSQSNWPEVRAVGHSSLPPPLPNHSQKYTITDILGIHTQSTDLSIHLPLLLSTTCNVLTSLFNVGIPGKREGEEEQRVVVLSLWTWPQMMSIPAEIPAGDPTRLCYPQLLSRSSLQPSELSIQQPLSSQIDSRRQNPQLGLCGLH